MGVTCADHDEPVAVGHVVHRTRREVLGVVPEDGKHLAAQPLRETRPPSAGRTWHTTERHLGHAAQVKAHALGAALLIRGAHLRIKGFSRFPSSLAHNAAPKN